MKFGALFLRYTCYKIFVLLLRRQMVIFRNCKKFSGHPEKCKSVETVSLIFLRKKKYFHFISVEEIMNNIEAPLMNYAHMNHIIVFFHYKQRFIQEKIGSENRPFTKIGDLKTDP